MVASSVMATASASRVRKFAVVAEAIAAIKGTVIRGVSVSTDAGSVPSEVRTECRSASLRSVNEAAEGAFGSAGGDGSGETEVPRGGGGDTVGGEFLEGGRGLVGEDAEEELVVDDDHGSVSEVRVARSSFLERPGEFAACDELFCPGGELWRERSGVKGGDVRFRQRCSSQDGGFTDRFR